MKRVEHRSVCGALSLFAVAVSVVTAARVEGVTISWPGTIQPYSGDDPLGIYGPYDPWGIGPSPVAFFLEFDVPDDAVDSADLNVEGAVFDISAARLTVGGMVAQLVSGAGADFRDGGVTTEGFIIPDVLSFGAVFSLNGREAPFLSVLGVSRETFSFSQLVEPPPVFRSTRIEAPGRAGTNAYDTQTYVGDPVTVTPEPSGVLLAAAAAGWPRRRR